MPRSLSCILPLALVAFLGLSLPGVARGQAPSDASLAAELKKVQEALGKLQDEVAQLRKELAAAGQKQEREATQRFVQALAADFLGSVSASRDKEAIHMLTKELRDVLKNDQNSLCDYVIPQNESQNSPLYAHRWTSWTFDSFVPAPNGNTFILKGTLKGTTEWDGKKYDKKRDITDTFSLHMVYDRGTELWKVNLFRVDPK
jgi:hypothetical protein